MSGNNVLKIGITGGIGAGKSLISKIFEKLGVPVYDADQRAKFLMENDPEIIKEIRHHFSDQAFNGLTLDRSYLFKTVFSIKEKLDLLNRIVHPAVRKDFDLWVLTNQHHPYLLKEAALLFESSSYRDLDQTILVIAPVEIRISRVLLRDRHRTRIDVENIIHNQMSDSQKKELADYVIQNDDHQLVVPEVLHLHQLFSQPKNSVPVNGKKSDH